MLQFIRMFTEIHRRFLKIGFNDFLPSIHGCPKPSFPFTFTLKLCTCFCYLSTLSDNLKSDQFACLLFHRKKSNVILTLEPFYVSKLTNLTILCKLLH